MATPPRSLPPDFFDEAAPAAPKSLPPDFFSEFEKSRYVPGLDALGGTPPPGGVRTQLPDLTVGLGAPVPGPRAPLMAPPVAPLPVPAPPAPPAPVPGMEQLGGIAPAGGGAPAVPGLNAPLAPRTGEPPPAVPVVSPPVLGPPSPLQQLGPPPPGGITHMPPLPDVSGDVPLDVQAGAATGAPQLLDLKPQAEPEATAARQKEADSIDKFLTGWGLADQIPLGNTSGEAFRNALARGALHLASPENIMIGVASGPIGKIVPYLADLPIVAKTLSELPNLRMGIDMAANAAMPATFTGLSIRGVWQNAPEYAKAASYAAMGDYKSAANEIAKYAKSNMPDTPQRDIAQWTETALDLLTGAAGAFGTFSRARAAAEAHVVPETPTRPVRPVEQELAEQLGITPEPRPAAGPAVTPQEAATIEAGLRAQGRNLAAETWANVARGNEQPFQVDVGGKTFTVNPMGTHGPGGKYRAYQVVDEQGDVVTGGRANVIGEWLASQGATRYQPAPAETPPAVVQEAEVPAAEHPAEAETPAPRAEAPEPERPAPPETREITPEMAQERLLDVMGQIEPQTGAPVSIRRLRAAVPELSKEQFDDAALQLRADQRVYLDEHAHVMSEPEDVRQQYVQEGDRHYIAITPRETEKEKPPDELERKLDEFAKDSSEQDLAERAHAIDEMERWLESGRDIQMGPQTNELTTPEQRRELLADNIREHEQIYWDELRRHEEEFGEAKDYLSGLRDLRNIPSPNEWVWERDSPRLTPGQAHGEAESVAHPESWIPPDFSEVPAEKATPREEEPPTIKAGEEGEQVRAPVGEPLPEAPTEVAPEPGGTGEVGGLPDESGEGVRRPPREPVAGEAPTGGGGGDTEGRVPTPRGVPPERISGERAGDYRITEETHLGEGGLKTKAKQNIEAIRLLKKLDEEGRPPTPEEQHVLARYVGWGAISQPFHASNWRVPEEWKSTRKELEQLLTPEEWERAAASTINSHYTSEEVVKGIWRALQHLGVQPKDFRVLEPGMGVGNFFGLMPEELVPHAKKTGVEMDTTTGRISQHLYPSANVKITPYQKASLPNNYFDVVTGNVPFANVPVFDSIYKRTPSVTATLHDYFIGKSLDKLRPGGIMAVITSNGTMDKVNSLFRRWVSDRANFLGAIRLPETSFQKNAGTTTTTDIVFLQKRPPQTPQTGETWATTEQRGTKDEPYNLNEYYVRHPEMMLGTMTTEGTKYRANEPTLSGEFSAQALNEAVDRLPANVFEHADVQASNDFQNRHLSDLNLLEVPQDGSMFIHNDTVMMRDGDNVYPVDLNARQAKVAKDVIPIRDILREVYNVQIRGGDDAQLEAAQRVLNKLYDDFVKKHGPLTKNAKVFKDDVEAPSLLALEDYKPETGKATKTDIFSKRTIPTYIPPEHAETAQEALGITLAERGGLDWPRMEGLTGKTREQLAEELGPLIYQDPERGGEWLPADEYLSGDVRGKLKAVEAAAEHDPQYQRNIEPLKAVQPEYLKEDKIHVKLGAPWIPQKALQDFAQEILGLPKVEIGFAPELGVWKLDHGGKYKGFLNENEWGTDRFYGHELLDKALNLQVPTVYDKVDGKRVINEYETVAAREKQDKLQKRFIEWLWEDPHRKKIALDLYNDMFNNMKLWEPNGAHLTLPGMNRSILRSGDLEPHQKNAVWRTIRGGNTLIAHAVGAGKTFEMIASAMEMRRLGLVKKPMFVVPNLLTEQWASDFKKLYPASRIMVLGPEDVGKDRRRLIMARIANGNWDAVIVPHSSFGKLGVSQETFETFMRAAIRDLEEAMTGATDKKTQKELEKAKMRLQEKIEKRARMEDRDKGMNFETLGVDQLYVDEADAFKNLFFATKMRRIAGIPNSESDRAFDMFMKARYLAGKTGGRGLVFATGTPITNSIAEMFTMQRYMDMDNLKDHNIQHFDPWVTSFAVPVTGMELAPEGTGYRVNSRFARFANVPELLKIFRKFTDVKTAEELNLPRPTVAGGKAQVIEVPTNPGLKRAMLEFQHRAEHIRGGHVDPSEDNMLKVVSDARKAGLDIRLFYPREEDAPNSKVNTAVKNIFDIWKETKKNKSTQLVFLDLGTPKARKEKKADAEPDEDDEGFDTSEDEEVEAGSLADQERKQRSSVYQDIKNKLMFAGVPENEIAFIHDAKKPQEKKALLGKVRAGDVRIMIGSTEKMGAGMNVQDKLYALHHLDVPWRPRDIEQREGRILRQGNENPEVRILRYVTEASFDAYMWQTIAYKAAMIAQAMSGDMNIREIEDVGTMVLSAQEAMAAASGNPAIREKIGVEQELRQLQLAWQVFDQEKRTARYSLEPTKSRLETGEQYLEDLHKEVAYRNEHQPQQFEMTVQGQTYSGEGAYKASGEALAKAEEDWQESQVPVKVGSYGGYDLWIKPWGHETREGKARRTFVVLADRGFPSNDFDYAHIGLDQPVRTAQAVVGLVKEGLDKKVKKVEASIEWSKKEIDRLQRVIDEPFDRQDRIDKLDKRLKELNQELDIDGKKDTQAVASDDEQGEESDAAQAKRRSKFTDPTMRMGAFDPELYRELAEDLRNLGGELASREIAPIIRGAADIIRDTRNDIMATLAPSVEIRGGMRGGKVAGHVIREMAAKLALGGEQAKAQMEEAAHASERANNALKRAAAAFQRVIANPKPDVAAAENFRKGLQQSLEAAKNEDLADLEAAQREEIIKLKAKQRAHLAGLTTDRGQEAAQARHEQELQEMEDSHQQEHADLEGQWDQNADKVSQIPASHLNTLEFIDRMERGSTQPNGDLQSLANTIRQLLDNRRERVQKLKKGMLENYLENYFPHEWSDPEQAKKVFAQIYATRPMQGRRAFLKRRTIPLTVDGVIRGLTPASWNPIDLALSKMREVDKFVLAHEAFNELKRMRMLKFVRARRRAPEGYAKINDNIATVYEPPTEQGSLAIRGYYWAPEPVARIINNYLSPGLRDKALYKAYLGAANVLNQFQLGWSFFHVGFTTIDAATSRVALGIYKAAHGKPLEGLTTAASAPWAPVTNVKLGHQLMQEALNPGQHPELAPLVEAIVAGGGRIRQDSFYQTHMFDKMMELWREGGLAARISAALRLPFGLTDLAMRPIMEWLVPRQKLGIFADMMRFEMERLGPNYTHEDLRDAAARAWDSTDNRMGQMVYDNLHWNKMLKDIAMGSVRSVGWNLGTIRELGGGIYDISPVGFTGPGGRPGLKRPQISYRSSYILAILLVTGLIGGVLTRMMSGRWPNQWKDLFFPIDKNGDRWSIPGYLKDLYHYGVEPRQTLINKLHPLLNLIAELMQNRDYFGTEIRDTDLPWLDPKDPLNSQSIQVLLHVLGTMEPFAARNVLKARQQRASGLSQWLTQFGLTPAPRILAQSPAERLAEKYYRQVAPAGSHTRAQRLHAQTLSQIRKDIQAGRKNEAREEIREALRQHLIGPRDIQNMRKTIGQSSLVRMTGHLNIGQMLNVYKEADAEERKSLVPVIRKTLHSVVTNRPWEMNDIIRQKVIALGLARSGHPARRLPAYTPEYTPAQ